MNETYEYPEKLMEYITEQESEGNEVFISHTEDGVMFIIPQSSLAKWIVLREWYDGDDDFQIINLTGKSWDRLKKTMSELEEESKSLGENQ